MKRIFTLFSILVINFCVGQTYNETTHLLNSLQHHFKLNNSDSVAYYTKKIFDFNSPDSVRLSAASVYSHMQKDNDKAFKYFNIIENELLKSKINKHLLGRLYLYKGSRYYENFLDKEALTFFIKSDSLYQAINKTTFFSAMAINGVCEVLGRSTAEDSPLNTNQLLPYINRGYKISDSLNFEVPKAIFVYKKGEIMFQQDSLQKSETYFKEALKISQSINNNIRIAMVYGNLSKIFEKQQNLDSAIVYQEKAVTVARNIEEKRVVMRENLRLGYLYNSIGKYDKAINYLQFARQNFESIVLERREPLHNIEFELAKSYFGKKEYKKGYHHLMKAKLIMEEIQLARNTDKVNELEAKYQTEKKESEIQLLKSEKELAEREKAYQRNVLFGVISISSLIGMFLFFLYRNNRKTSKALQELDKNKSNFFANISHEIRTPITLIKGYTEELDTTNQKQKDIKNSIDKQISNITEMVNSVLDLAKMQTAAFKISTEDTNIADLLKELFVNFKPLFEHKNLELKFENLAENAHAKIDKTYIKRVFNNLLVNALKYTEIGSVTVKTLNKDDVLIISVEDTGIGIQPQDLNNVFNRFYQVNNNLNKAGGSGIGLAFSKEIVELHGGEVKVKSTPNKGSVFEIYLPLVAEHNSVENNEELDITSTTPKQKAALENTNFLIIDDNSDMRSYLTSVLKNYKCYEAENGIEGLQVLEEKEIDFVITDYMMPKMDGLAFINAVKEKGFSLPIIMLTAKTDINSKLEILSLGVEDYITKPFDKSELLIRIKNLLDNKTERENYNKELNQDVTEVYNDDLLLKLKNYIYENANNTELNQDVITQQFGISKSTLYRKVKSQTGLNPTEFIREVKLLKAKQILEKNSDILLKQLALEVGFVNTFYFSQIFEERFGQKLTNK